MIIHESFKEFLSEGLEVQVTGKTFTRLDNSIAKGYATYSEYVNPSYIELTLSDGRDVKIEAKQFKAGTRSKIYQALLSGLDDYTSDKKAKKKVDTIINGLFENLNEAKGAELTYGDAISYKPFDEEITSHIEANWPDEYYFGNRWHGGGKAGMLGKFGYGLNMSNITKLKSFAKKNKDTKLTKKVEAWLKHDKDLKKKYNK